MKSIINYQLSIINENRKQQKGQVALIVLLISAVVMTLGLSISKKVTTETKIDTNEELSKQSFNAAESGVDYYLSTKNKKYTSSNSIANVEVNLIGGENTIDLRVVDAKEHAFFWLVGHDPVTEEIDFGDSYGGSSLSLEISSSFRGSLSVDLYYKEGTEYKVNRAGYNFGTSPIVNNYVTTMGSSVDISSLLPPTTATRLLLVVTPLFLPTTLKLTGTSDFPEQGEEIASTGMAGGDLTDDEKNDNKVSRKVTVSNGYEVPDFLLEAVSGNNVLSK